MRDEERQKHRSASLIPHPSSLIPAFWHPTCRLLLLGGPAACRERPHETANRYRTRLCQLPFSRRLPAHRGAVAVALMVPHLAPDDSRPSPHRLYFLPTQDRPRGGAVEQIACAAEPGSGRLPVTRPSEVTGRRPGAG